MKIRLILFSDERSDNIANTNGSEWQTASTQAINRVALLFHASSFFTLAIVSILWRAVGRKRRQGVLSAGVDTDHLKYDIRDHDRLSHTYDVLMRAVWKPCLAALAISLTGICFLAGAMKPSPDAKTALSLLLGTNGVLFALANWVPYALIGCESSSARIQPWALTTTDSNRKSGEDLTPTLLAIHNMAVTVPQIVASVASWSLMQGLAVLGFEQNIVWIFVICIPPALWAACL